MILLNTSRPRQNGRHFTTDIFKCIFLNEHVSISLNISLKFVPGGQIKGVPVLLQIIAWCRPGGSPREQSSWGQHGAHLGHRWAPCWPHEPYYHGSLSEPRMISLPTDICNVPSGLINKDCVTKIIIFLTNTSYIETRPVERVTFCH